MTEQESFTKHEHTILPNFRENINRSESTEDVKKFFIYSIQELFKHVFEGRINFEYEDIALTPESDSSYRLSERILNSKDFSSVWKNSDLSRVISRLAESALHRYKHLKKNPGKTDSKIRR